MGKSRKRVLIFTVFAVIFSFLLMSYRVFAQEHDAGIPDGFVLTPTIIERDVAVRMPLFSSGERTFSWPGLIPASRGG